MSEYRSKIKTIAKAFLTYPNMSGRHTVSSLVCSRDPKSRIVLNASIWATRKIRTSIFFVLLHPLPVPN